MIDKIERDPEQLASQVAEIEANRGAGLPHRNDDPIMRLMAHYFEPADFMLENFLKLDRLSVSSKGLSRTKVVERRYFLMFWLAGLYVTVEGIEDLPLYHELESRPLDIPEIAERIPPLLLDFDLHKDSLRLLRNAQSHYQSTSKKHVQFFEERTRLRWALDIHNRIKRIFSDYRIGCTVVCAFAGRKDEIDIKRRGHPVSKVQFMT